MVWDDCRSNCCMPRCRRRHMRTAVLLLSLRAQLAAPAGTTRPAIVAALNSDQAHDQGRCTAVLWVPRSPNHFVACFSSGNVLVYKKVRARANVGEGLGLAQGDCAPCPCIHCILDLLCGLAPT